MNTVALKVDEAVFHATHHPSFLQQEGAAPGTLLPLAEGKFLEDFLSEREYVFDVAVGDAGTGKSHLVRWIQHEIERQEARGASKRWAVVLIPRASANLADALKSLLQGHSGETVKRLQKELEDAHKKASTSGAQTRVLDELAYVIEENAPPHSALFPKLATYRQDLLKRLPALLRSQEVRNHLKGRPGGIVVRLAEHALGTRKEIAEDAADLHWSPSDLDFPLKLKIGGEAADVASDLRDNLEDQKFVAEVLDTAWAPALKTLLGLRRGDLGKALAEIRRELKMRGQELVLLVEDVSVTQGLDTDLIEALLPDSNAPDLCRLRALIGLTPEDFKRLPDNIRGRLTRVVRFNMGFNVEVGGDSPEGAVGPSEIVALAAKYLDASRFPMDELRERFGPSARSTNEPTRESFCQASGCPNVEACHKAFGTDPGGAGIGLYPFTAGAIVRLYERVKAQSTHAKAFNPRLLVGRVLGPVLEAGESSLPAKEFPPSVLRDSFQLLDLDPSKADKLGPRLSTALELYSPDPNTCVLPDGIPEALDFHMPRSRASRKAVETKAADAKAPEQKAQKQGDVEPRLESKAAESKAAEPNTTASKHPEPRGDEPELAEPKVAEPSGVEPKIADPLPGGAVVEPTVKEPLTPEPKVATRPKQSKRATETSKDEFHRWFYDGDLSDVNAWRGLVHAAISAWIDWDSSGLAPVKDAFKRQHIHFEGQVTEKTKGDVTIEVKRSLGAFKALRALKNNITGGSPEETEEWLLAVAVALDEWGREVVSQLHALRPASLVPSPLILAGQALAAKAWIRGRRAGDEAALLSALLEPWSSTPSEALSQEWKDLGDLLGNKRAEEVRTYLQRNLTCAKGGALKGQIDEEDDDEDPDEPKTKRSHFPGCIDPTPILPALRQILEQGAIPPPPKGPKWDGTRGEIRALYEDVSKRIKKAAEAERKECIRWLEAVRPLAGAETSRTTAEVVARAFEAAEGHLTHPDAKAARAGAKTFGESQLPTHVTAAGVVATADGLALLDAIGALDRSAMHNSRRFLEQASAVVETAITHFTALAKAEGGAGAGDILSTEIGTYLEQIETALKTIGRAASPAAGGARGKRQS
jgi:hypothetical protein